MPAEISLIERNRIADDMFSGEDFEIRAYSNTVSATGTGGTEITAAGYSPISITNNTTNFPAATTGTRTNAVVFQKQFTAAATIVSMAIFSASGVFLARKIPASPIAVGAGEYWRFNVGAISFAVNNPA